MGANLRLVAAVALLLAASSVAGGALSAEGVAAEGAPAVAERPTPPRRIVSTNLTSDEILLALEPATEIVALSAFADDPQVSNVVEQARAIPHRVRGDAERILALEPGVVFAFPFGQAETEALLRQAGIPVVHVPGASTVAEIRDNVRRIGRVVGREKRAEALIEQMDATIARVQRRIAGARRPGVLYWNTGGFTAGAGTLPDALLELAGGRNVAAEAGIEGHAPVPMERVLALDPEVVLVVDYRADERKREVVPPPRIADDPLWQDVEAVREGRVRYVPERHLLSSSHHAARAVVDIARVLHPERVQ